MERSKRTSIFQYRIRIKTTKKEKKMKIIHSAITDGLSGTAGTSTFMRSKSSKFSYRREWAQPARTEQNDKIGKIAKNIARQVDEINPLAITQLKEYAKKYKHIPHYGDKYKERAGNWFAVWTLFIYNFKKNINDLLDLENDSFKEYIEGSDVNSIKEACEFNLLPKVPGYEEMTNQFFTT